MEKLIGEGIFKKYVNVLSKNKLPASLDQCKQQKISFEEVQYIVHHLPDFIIALPEEISRSTIICKLSELLVIYGLVAEFQDEDRDFSREDFLEIPENAVKCFECLNILLHELPVMEQSSKRHFFIQALLLMATHSGEFDWSNADSVSHSQEFLENMLRCTGYRKLSDLLCDEAFYPTVFKGTLKQMRPYLNKDTWMMKPSSCYVFRWLLRQVTHPHLADYLPDIFPPPFMFVSYHGVPQKVVGLQCFDHLLDNVPQTLIKLDGKADAIFHTIHYLIHDKNIEIIQVLFPCILKLPGMKAQSANRVCWGEFDQVFHQLLVSTDMECNLQVKQTFLTHVLAFVEQKPPFVHLKLLKSILKETLVSPLFPDKTSQVSALKIIRSIIQSCWPRMKHHCFDILVYLLELLEQNVLDSSDERYKLCEECLTLLKYSCDETFTALTSNYMKDPSMPGVALLKQVSSSTS